MGQIILQFLSRVGSTKQLYSKDSRDEDDISRGTLTGNAVCAVTRTINKFPIEVELKVRYNKIHGENRFPGVVSSWFSSSFSWKLFGISRKRFS